MDSATESNLLSKLQSPGDLTDLHHLFSSHLSPFSALLNPPISRKPKKAPSKTIVDSDHQTTVRSLAKQFLHFLNRALSLLPKRLSETPSVPEESAVELFEIYKLCLNCIDSISSQLLCKSYYVQIQRVRLIHCLEAWGRYKDAESEGFSVLRALQGVDGGVLWQKTLKSKTRLVPECKESVDPEFTLLVVEVVLTLVKCVSMNKSREEDDYHGVISLVDEVRPWFRVLDAGTYEKRQRVLVTYLNKCCCFLVGELMHFNGRLVHQFCLATFTEYTESSIKDQMHKFARRICSTMFSQQESGSLVPSDIIRCVLDFMANECKVGQKNAIMEFFELVHYCANKCQTTNVHYSGLVATHLKKIAGGVFQVLSPINLIVELYAIGLWFCDFKSKRALADSTTMANKKDGSNIGFVFLKEDVFQDLTALLGLLKCHFNVSHKSSSSPFTAENKNSVYPSSTEFKYEVSSLQRQNGLSPLLCYYNALQFLCQPLADFVNSEKKEILDIETTSLSSEQCIILDALNQFCDVFLICQSAHVMERDAFDDNSKTVLSAAVAAFTLSLSTKRGMKECVNFIKHVISTDWIQAHGLKHLFISLYNVGVILYRHKQVKLASKALKLSCRASWGCVLNMCEMFLYESNGFNGDLSQNTVIGFATEACAKTAFLWEVLSQCGSSKLNRVVRDGLESWSVAENLLKMLSCPRVLVKQWVKIQCKSFKEDVEHSPATLYSLLSSSSKVSRKTLGILLEQELLSYQELNALNPKFCRTMQIEITKILLEKVYITEDYHLEKSKILISKGRQLRDCGIENLNECIECLSEAISTLRQMNGETFRSNVQVLHQLAYAYCIRALCTQEANPNSKQLVQDIHGAVYTWLAREQGKQVDQCDTVSEDMLILLYHVIDLLSIKGCMDLHADVYKVLLKLFKLKNIPLEKCLILLWESRRLSHALCASPVNETFITTLSKYYDETVESVDFWIGCMKGSQSLLVGFQQSFSLAINSSQDSCHDESHSQSDIMIDAVKQAASDLITGVPLSSSSVFIAGYLYYDLCEKLISEGRLVEALSYAKEALCLRSRFVQEKFIYSSELMDEIYNETGEIIQKRCYGLKTFHIRNSAATTAWSWNDVSCHFEEFTLTPWSVLQCYLESTLQVGMIQEILGNGLEAESLLLWGKNISCLHGLPPFIVYFSSLLGQLYRKQQLWVLSEKELHYANQILSDNPTAISCSKCRLVMEAIIDTLFGDLSRSRPDNGAEYPSNKMASYAEKLYRSAVDKLNLSEWKHYVSDPGDESAKSIIGCTTASKNVRDGDIDCFRNSRLNQPDVRDIPSKDDIQVTKKGIRSRKTRKALKPVSQGLCLKSDNNLRMTRSRYRSSLKNAESIEVNAKIGSTTLSTGEPEFICPDRLVKRTMEPESKCCVLGFGCEVICSCNKMKCWHRLPFEVSASGSLSNFVDMKWEFVRRRLLVRLLTNIGKCVGALSDVHQVHEIFLQSISVMVSRNLFQPAASSSVPVNILLDLLGKKIPGDVLAVERASLLYNICWFTLKSYHCMDSGVACCDFSGFEMIKIVYWLTLAFILCREVPMLFQKVSKLLAALYVVSASLKPFASLSPGKLLSESQWASYFHQASLGTNLNHQFLSSMMGKQKNQNPLDHEASVSGSTYVGSERLNSFRLAPESLQDLEGFILNFFEGLPCSTVICVSLLGGAYASLLRELLLYPSSVRAWILLSRLNPNGQPVVVLLPVESILEEASKDASSSSRILFGERDFVKRWPCPWGSTIVDDVAPIFKLILEENYLSSSKYVDDSKENRSSWWIKRKRLDLWLSKFLRDVEDSWFGPWKYLFMGEWSDCKNLDSFLKKLVDDLKRSSNLDVDESLLKVILGGAKYLSVIEESFCQLILNNGCGIGLGHFDHERTQTIHKKYDYVENLSPSVFKLILETANRLPEVECTSRKPIILVLDFDVQMLPWENLPILRNQEVYRMPSVGSINATLDRSYHHLKKVEAEAKVFPLIDPLDAYYVLNPSGDLGSTQETFESWFRDQNLEGKSGTPPTTEELSVALKSHDLFIYFGHGSGAQYIPGHEIQKFESCAATLLMGCSSGSLSLSGGYAPQGVPLCYLLAGSPVIVANLWEVTDKDIDRFAKAMLDAWLKERSKFSEGCALCNLVSNEFESMDIGENKRNGKKKALKKKLAKASDVCMRNGLCSHRPKIGSFMAQAREACTLPFLIGAAPVCYGVPTGIRKKKNL